MTEILKKADFKPNEVLSYREKAVVDGMMFKVRQVFEVRVDFKKKKFPELEFFFEL